MASSSKAPCATCNNKAAGIFRCEGCVQVFCRKHLNEHRDILSHQLDEIVQEHDTLQQVIVENKEKNKNQQHPILKQIDKWEKDSIVKIQQIGEEAREKVKQLTNSQTIFKNLHDLAEQLQKARLDDDYVETDLDKWMTTMQKLKNDVNTHSPSIYIQEDQSQILVAKMFVSTTVTTTTVEHSKQREIFGETFGDINIDNNGLLAMHCGSKNGTACVRGTGEYSFGKHNIHFLFKKNDLQYITSFQINTKLMPIHKRNGEIEYTCYGWSSNDRVYSWDTHLMHDETYKDMRNQTSFNIELQLDCDNRKISYINQRTKKRREMDVDITKCPFPWQVEFYLYAIGDCVRILP